ncbi:MAG: hypothetical protein IPM54_30630 [Polyangiaceae bacterium]|nr:hypothetical protein [Polyangiaceae bacterium]
MQNCTDKACADECLKQSPQGQPVYDCTCKSCTNDCGGLCDSGSSSSSSSGMPTCSSCSDLLQGNLGQPCDGSAQLIGALYACACQQNCTMECGTICQGGQPDQTCLGCVSQKCGSELGACLQD